VTLGGNACHARAPATGNARSSSEDRRVVGTTTSVLEAELARLNLRHELEIHREIFRAEALQTAIYQDAQFEVHAFCHRQLVKLLCDRLLKRGGR